MCSYYKRFQSFVNLGLLLLSSHLSGATVVQVLLYKLHTCSEISGVELIWYVPPQRPKFAPFLQLEGNNNVNHC